MISVPLLPSQPLPRLFLMPVDSQLHEFLRETHRIVEFEPAILQRIESDLDAYGLKKKLLREADRRFLEGQTFDLPTLKIELRQINPLNLELEVGRPRLEPYFGLSVFNDAGTLGWLQRPRCATASGRIDDPALVVGKSGSKSACGQYVERESQRRQQRHPRFHP